MATSRRVGNYATSANAVIRNSDAIFDAAMSGKPDFTKISKEAIKGRSMERRAVTKAEADVASAGLDAFTKTNYARMRADTAKKVEDIKRPARRMAGVVGALGTLSGAFVLGQNTKKDKQAALERERKFDERTEQLMAAFNKGTNVELEQIPDAIPFQSPELQPFGNNDSGSNSSSSSNQSGNQSSSKITYQSSPLAGAADVSKLTSDDYQHLAYAISSEAGPGKDRYGVAASILNRVSSDKWPGTVKDVIYQDGQYEGVYTGLSRQSPDIAADLSSDAGRNEILKALKVLDGRTDFKGQSMLKYRSNKGNKGGIMDPMFDPKGNFFHYSHQS